MYAFESTLDNQLTFSVPPFGEPAIGARNVLVLYGRGPFLV
jgi:hypothetical protein